MRDRSLETRLQLAGLDAPFSEDMNHVLLKPIGFRLVLGEDPISPQDYMRAYADDPDVLDDWMGFKWDRLEIVELRSGQTSDCLFDLARLGEYAPDPEQVFGSHRSVNAHMSPQFLEGVFEFVGKWGLLQRGDGDHDFSRSDYCELETWDVPSMMTRAILLGLAATEAGELVPEKVARSLGEFRISDEESRLNSIAHEQIMHRIHHGPPFEEHELDPLMKAQREEHRVIAHDNFIREWEQARQEGRGVEFQRDLITPAFRDSLPQNFWVMPVWTGRGRHLELEAFGAASVAAAHLLTLFASPRIGVSVCSVCGRLYPLQEESRRPRTGMRRFCSESCRDTAKREDKLAAWHRNKVKWRKPEGRNGDA